TGRHRTSIPPFSAAHWIRSTDRICPSCRYCRYQPQPPTPAPAATLPPPPITISSVLPYHLPLPHRRNQPPVARVLQKLPDNLIPVQVELLHLGSTLNGTVLEFA